MTAGGAPPSGGDSGCVLMFHGTKLGRAEREGGPVASLRPASGGGWQVQTVPPQPSTLLLGRDFAGGPFRAGVVGRRARPPFPEPPPQRRGRLESGLRGRRVEEAAGLGRAARLWVSACVGQTCAGPHFVAGAVLEVGGAAADEAPELFHRERA